LDEDYIKAIKLPKQNPLEANLYTLEEIETDKMTTLEKVINLNNLKEAIEKKLEKIHWKELQAKPVVIDLEFKDNLYRIL